MAQSVFELRPIGNKHVKVRKECKLVASTTTGIFRVTGGITKALELRNGDYIMFLNNIGTINEAIEREDDFVVKFCNNRGFAVGSKEAAIALHKAFDMWGLAKGVIEYDSLGIQQTIDKGITTADKHKYILDNFTEIYKEAIENAPQDIVDLLVKPGITKAEQINIMAEFIKFESIPKYRGAKLINFSGSNETGLSLTFCDVNVWLQLKHGLSSAEKHRFNRIFTSNDVEIQEINVFNGYEYVKTKALLLDNEYADKLPAKKDYFDK